MPDLEKRVAETLAAHDFRLEYQNTGARFGTIVCGCGNRYGLSDSHRAHVAERINYAVAPVIAEHVRAERADQEAEDLLMHRAYRAEVVAEIAVSLDDECNWEHIAEWCGGKLDSGPNGTDTGEWDSWITLPNGEIAGNNEWIVLDVKGEFHVRQLVGEPDTGTLPAAQAKALREAADTLNAHADRNERDAVMLAFRTKLNLKGCYWAVRRHRILARWLRARADKLVTE